MELDIDHESDAIKTLNRRLWKWAILTAAFLVLAGGLLSSDNLALVYAGAFSAVSAFAFAGNIDRLRAEKRAIRKR